MSRRTGQSRHNQQLLSQVAGMPRGEYDAIASSADDSSDTLRTLVPTTWGNSSTSAASSAASTTATTKSANTKTTKPTKSLGSIRPTATTKSTGNPAAKRLRLEDANCYSSDELARADAPSVAPHAAKTRTVRQHPKPPASKQSRGERKPPQPSQSPPPKSSSELGGVGRINLNHTNYMASVFAGKSTGEALEDGLWSTHSTPSWEDRGSRKRTFKKFKGRAATAALAYKQAPKEKTKQVSTEKSNPVVGSASDDEARPIKKKIGPKRAAGSKQQPSQKASRPKKRQESTLLEISSDDDDILNQIVKPPAFIDPEPKFHIESSLDDSSPLSSPGRRRPSPQLKVFRNPMEEYPTPPNKSDYKELGLDQEIEPLVFTDPFADDPAKPDGVGDKAPAKKKPEARTAALRDREVVVITSSPATLEPTASYAKPPTLGPAADRQTLEMMGEIAAIAGVDDVKVYQRRVQSAVPTDGACRLCHDQLPEGYLESWKDQAENGIIRLEMWAKICQAHTREALEERWHQKGYPALDWAALAGRVTRHLAALRKIVMGDLPSRYRDLFAQQQREIKGRTAMLLRQERKLPFPGYYGPRGADILLNVLQTKLGRSVGRAADTDPLIGRGGVSAFVQHVLVPEVGVRLIAEDMGVGEAEAARILEDSVDIGEKLHPTAEQHDLYGDDDDDAGWVDVNATQQQRLTEEQAEDDGWEAMLDY